MERRVEKNFRKSFPITQYYEEKVASTEKDTNGNIGKKDLI